MLRNKKNYMIEVARDANALNVLYDRSEGLEAIADQLTKRSDFSSPFVEDREVQTLDLRLLTVHRQMDALEDLIAQKEEAFPLLMAPVEAAKAVRSLVTGAWGWISGRRK
jgi:hypothetical protein